jgi:hypothetical protein
MPRGVGHDNAAVLDVFAGKHLAKEQTVHLLPRRGGARVFLVQDVVDENPGQARTLKSAVNTDGSKARVTNARGSIHDKARLCPFVLLSRGRA